MPTAAKIIAALCMAVVGYVVSEVIKTLMPEGTGFGYFSWVNTILGVFVGWIVVGKRAGRGTGDAIGNGITGVVVLVLWGLLIQSSYEMFQLSMKRRFDGPVEAFAAIFELSIEYGTIMVDAGVIGVLVVGALVTGYATEYAARHWR